MKRLARLLFTTLFALQLYGEPSIGPLPPLSISLNAPIQIDEGNVSAQEQLVDRSPEHLQQLLTAKRFPIEGVVVILVIGIGYLFRKRWMIKPQKPEAPPLTPEQRVERAGEILTQAEEFLTDREAISLFHLIDPLATLFSAPQQYQKIAEQTKFAGYALKKTEFIQIAAPLFDQGFLIKKI